MRSRLAPVISWISSFRRSTRVSICLRADSDGITTDRYRGTLISTLFSAVPFPPSAAATLQRPGPRPRHLFVPRSPFPSRTRCSSSVRHAATQKDRHPFLPRPLECQIFAKPGARQDRSRDYTGMRVIKSSSSKWRKETRPRWWGSEERRLERIREEAMLAGRSASRLQDALDACSGRIVL